MQVQARTRTHTHTLTHSRWCVPGSLSRSMVCACLQNPGRHVDTNGYQETEVERLFLGINSKQTGAS